jgi:hypothetical protein
MTRTRISEVRALAMDGRVSLQPEDTVFARISLLAGWREGTAGHGWPSVPVAMDGEKGPLTKFSLFTFTFNARFDFLL